MKTIPRKQIMQGLNNTNNEDPSKGSSKMNPNKDQTNNNNHQIYFKKDLFDQVIRPMSTVPSKEDTVENNWGMISKKIAPQKEVHCNPTNQLDKDPDTEIMKENEPEKATTTSINPNTMGNMNNKDLISSMKTTSNNDKIIEVHEEKGEITQPKSTMTKGHNTMDIVTSVRGDSCRQGQPPSIGEHEPKMTKVKFKTTKEPLLYEST
jgi:hypothetical protein